MGETTSIETQKGIQMKYGYIRKNNKYLGGGYVMIVSQNLSIADGNYIEQHYANLRAAKAAGKKQNLIVWM
jgi:hypothetical protein